MPAAWPQVRSITAAAEHVIPRHLSETTVSLILLFGSAWFLGGCSPVGAAAPASVAPADPRPWWLGDLLTVLSIVIGFLVVMLQLRKQHTSDIAVQKENHREQLRLEIYEDFSTAMAEANSKTLESSMYARWIPLHFEAYLHEQQRGGNPRPIPDRYPRFMQLDADAHKAVVRLIFLIEKYEIVGPEMNIFKLAFNSATHNMREAAMPLYSVLVRILPMDFVALDGQPITLGGLVLNTQEVAELKRLVDAYISALDEAGDYLYDLQVELQNVFLSPLFAGRKVSMRKPLDPGRRVITTDPERMRELEDYFLNESPWGKHTKEVEARVKESLGIQDNGDHERR